MTNRVVCLASQLFACVTGSMDRSSLFNYAGDIGGRRVVELLRVVSLSEHHQSASQRSIARIRVHLGNPQTHAASMQQQAATPLRQRPSHATRIWLDEKTVTQSPYQTDGTTSRGTEAHAHSRRRLPIRRRMVAVRWFLDRSKKSTYIPRSRKGLASLFVPHSSLDLMHLCSSLLALLSQVFDFLLRLRRCRLLSFVTVTCTPSDASLGMAM